MQSRGMLEPIQIYARVTAATNSGKPIARARVLAATLSGYVTTGGGTNVPAQEGVRTSGTHQIFFLNDDSLTDANYKDRWVIFPNRSQTMYRLMEVQQVGVLYSWGMTETGGTADAAGNVR
jgi:hypothetical protein